MPVNPFDDYPMSWRPEIDRNSVIYRSLAEQLEKDIVSGKLLPGTMLPPQRELADYLDINLATVAKAFKICSEKGILSSAVGRGTYVAYNAAARISSSVDDKNEVIEMGVMMPETVRQDEINALLREILDENDYGRYFQYSIHVDSWQRSAAADLLGQYGCETAPERVCFSNGAQNILSAIMAGTFSPGDSIGTDPFIYAGLKSIASMFGVRLVRVGSEGGEMTEAGIRYAVKNRGVKALYIMPDCQNPTTHMMSREGREMIARVAEELDLIVIEDSMDRIVQEHTGATVYSMIPDRTFFVLSLSKAINPALRLAFTAVPERFLGRTESALYNMNLSLSALLLEIASRLIVSKRFDGVAEDRRQGIRERNAITDEVLAEYDLRGNELNLGRWLILPEGLTGSGFEKEAMRRGVSVYGGGRFAVGESMPYEAARISICSPADTDKLRRGLEVLKEILDQA
ncbi:MAG: PLP-dependent aminotransferase family protein [Anaerovoracaceae bacterium]|nr:PLP-dependent aminotransferase family protein [Anaerovoracaceae bacterium]